MILPRLTFVLAGAALAIGAAPPPVRAVAPAPEAKKKCPKTLVFDVAKGTLNGVGPSTPLAKVKKEFPCFTGETKEGEVYNYGGGVFYVDHDFYFYTYARFIEIRPKFAGTVKPAVFGKSRDELATVFAFLTGKTERPFWSTADDEFVKSRAGCVQFGFNRGTLERVRSYSVDCGVIKKPA